ncbi:MAG: c-type cytochrome [Gemmatimonadota bacterium]|nr:c-type cytochrome [Gemmatimonadota bacterium]
MKRRLVLKLAAIAGFLATAGIAATRSDNPFADFVESGFPFIVSTIDAGKLGAGYPERNLAVRCVILMLGNDSYACFDTDLLRMSAAWRGGFVSLTTMAQISYQQAGNKNNAISRVLGSPVIATGMYPGWTSATPDFRDPRAPGPEPTAMGRGPLPAGEAYWNGLSVVGKEAVLSYTVAGTDIHEEVGSITAGGQLGITRTFQTGITSTSLTLVVAEVPAGGKVEQANNVIVITGAAGDTATAVGIVAAPPGATLRVVDNRYVTLGIPAHAAASRFRVIAWRGKTTDRSAMTAMLAESVRMADYAHAGAPHWPAPVTTVGKTSPDSADYVLDRLTLPLSNPWRRNVRVADVDFFRDGRAAVVTFEGDVWIVSGVDRTLGSLTWKRFASGLYEPLSIAVVRDTIYVYDRQGIVRLRDINGDGEADVYENFTNLTQQSGESREFPLGMAAKPGGGFYLAIGGALDNGPKTSPVIMPGFRAGSSQSGTVQEVSADGRSIRTFATGLREPIIGVDQRTGIIASSDQQGNFVPATPIFLLKEGGYYGVTPTAHRPPPLPTPELPLLWIPHEVDQSGAGEVWVPGTRMGFGGDALVHLSYGRPGPFRVYVDSARTTVQGALIALPGAYAAPTLKGRVGPSDGQLYLAGFSVWGSNAKEVSSLVRLRYTGKPSRLPVAVHSGLQGILVRFGTALDAATASDAAHFHLERWNYVRTSAYGSGHFKLDGTPGQDKLSLSPHLSADGRTLLLVVPDMKPAMQLQLDYDVKSRTGQTLRDTLYLTAHAVDSLDLARAGFPTLNWRADAIIAAKAPGVAPKTEARSTAALGATLYQEKGCAGCHSVDGTLTGKIGPSFKGLYGSDVKLTSGATRKADNAYLRHSILEPASEIVKGFEPGMPTYKGVLTETEIESLIRYIATLRKK